MEELDLVRLDRELARAALAWRRWRRGLARGAGTTTDPFVPFTSVRRLSFEAVNDRPEYDPLRSPTLRWLFRLLDEKANRPLIAAEAEARTVVHHPLEQPEKAELTLSEILRRALSDDERRKAWLAELFARGTHAGHHARAHWERRREVAARLKLASPDDLELPCPELYELAERWLDASQDVADEHRRDDFAEVVHLGLAQEAAAGWPTRIAPDTLSRFFRETRLLEGLPLDPGELPAALAPASFLRALARLGAAFQDASAARDQPFVIANDPYGLRRRTLGALFALLPATRAFSRRVLGLASGPARDHERALGRSLLIESRAAALRVLLRRPALDGPKSFMGAFEALTERSLGAALPPDCAGLVLRLHADDAQRLAGLWLAAAETRELVERHDEDWFRNPRAADQLRSEASLPPATSATRGELETGSAALLALLAEKLG